MASTSSSMAFSRPNQTRFDVFLSFRGEDTRHSFTDHLYAALKRAAIHTFRDNDEIRRGRDLEPEIVKAIENSRASIVIVSENYAKSRWCLQELSLILEQNRKGNHFVLPVFYKVDPSDVRNQRQSFAIEGSKWTEVNVSKWKSALREVANLSGMVASGPETHFIANVVDTVHYELDLKLISTPTHLTGMETRAEDINSWLKDEHSNTNVLAICGMGDEDYVGSETIEGLAVDMRKLKKGTKALAINADSLAKMHRLKLLQLNYVKLSGYYKNFPELRWLCWHGFHLKTIPSSLLMSNFLVAIDMTGGNMEKFEPPLGVKNCGRLH
ncbi:hypothetical protein L1987_27807 [Smallanthus sonchifolius]|uniref:Uncharacterized protein n=1 Tax=Smallanthus sonchifolius TaxID=185202 RepID=A0ACB9IBH6_9ASTR|nr:hypothetical protein L1987_27807 [Smallanthus sonchifolius]